MMDHSYCSGKDSKSGKSASKKRKYDEASRKIRQNRRQKSRINIGVAFPRRKGLMREKGFQSDAEVACFLLDRYETGPATSTPLKIKPFQVPAPALSSIGASSGTDRDEHLDVIVEATEIQGLEQRSTIFGGVARLPTHALWVSILHHVCNIHTWTMGSCKHGHLESEQIREKVWIQRDSQCHKALVDIVLNKRWQKDVHKYLKFRSTADLESFNNHILMYASKRYAFSPPVYEARILLAALDYNFHLNRPTMKTLDGKEIFKRLYKKNARRYSVYAMKSEKNIWIHFPAAKKDCE
ncbi:uncharacterized protein LOC130085456 isoform X3 [Rhinichthys klamathensis goyatoka]|uniref:uncharacterized protein LOC130085456 isoform X3 n=1 Tax=Rhinichthys klamathensis goyatoka TaxID=3034132 RepID=UPI0024B61295|nr:uncharacterized protein LOC130085456 isoform X3 [Rhinichthys klamathensis goyatoka]